MTTLAHQEASVAQTRTSFENYRDDLIHSWLRILTMLGYALIPIFFILDSVMMPSELLSKFAIYRGLATGLVLLQNLMVRRMKPSRIRSVLRTRPDQVALIWLKRRCSIGFHFELPGG